MVRIKQNIYELNILWSHNKIVIPEIGIEGMTFRQSLLSAEGHSSYNTVIT